MTYVLLTTSTLSVCCHIHSLQMCKMQDYRKGGDVINPINITPTENPSEKTFTFSVGARYLGSSISFPLDQTKDLDQRIQAAWQSWSKISSAFCRRLVSPNMRQRAFNACIMSVVLYGCECWTLRSSDKERLAIVQRMMERRMLRITLRDRWTNERIRQETKVRDWVKEALKRKLQWADKIRKMEDSRWARATTVWIPYGYSRTQRRPRARWRDEVSKVVGQGWWSKTREEWKTAIDQHIWALLNMTPDK